MTQLRPTYPGEGLTRWTADQDIDLFVDGALGSHTAWLRDPYAGAPDCCGNAYLGAEAVLAHLRACTGAGITAGFHVIGDAAVTVVVDAFEALVAELGVPAVARCGHRLEHLEMVDAEAARKLGSWGIVASMQPNFDALWGGADGMYIARDVALLGGYQFSGFNQTLLRTGALEKGSNQRFAETMQWALDVVDAGGLDKFGSALQEDKTR